MAHIAIDSNVFEHLLNPDWNGDSHIDHLLIHLQKKKFQLCVDTNGRITSEYDRIIMPIIKNRDEGSVERYILSYWMIYCERKNASVDENDARMACIRGIITENELFDRVFVYVACSEDCKLVTNDTVHILARRKDLLKATKKRFRGSSTDFLSSREFDQAIGAAQ